MKLINLLFAFSAFDLICCQLSYYDNKWSVPISLWKAIDNHQKLCQEPRQGYYNGTIEKFLVATFIARFKYSGFDPESSTTPISKNAFQAIFPTVRRREPNIKRACEISSEDCVHHIFLQLHIKVLDEINDEDQPTVKISIHHRSAEYSSIQLFRFKTTAMLYLCYWSILIDDPINEFIWPCRYPGTTLPAPTWRRCMLDAVCPNPCCGEAKVESTDNECNELSVGLCSKYVNSSRIICRRTEGFKFYKDLSFKHFFQYGPQFECGCPATQRWDSDCLMCLDEDECLNGEHQCNTETQYCVNKVQGYFCVCRYGYQMKSTGECVAKI
ncbi:hypothetical protein CHUAL_008135 [Chamberlinius hualienensis]